MRINKALIAVIVVSILALIAVLCWRMTTYKGEQPVEKGRLGESIVVDAARQQQAAAFLKGQISEISEQLLNDFPNDIYLVKTVVPFHQRCLNYYKVIAVLERASKNFPNNFW
ncbi:MAG: hypothetical protein ACYSPI_00220, partial [Planctomycetota bacterium]